MFICDKCGECCRNIGKVEELKHLDNGFGVCINLDESGLCKIYDMRPDICRVDDMYELLFKNSISRATYEKLNYYACAELKKIKDCK